MSNLFSDALARYHEQHPVSYDENAWASKILACPAAHAYERLGTTVTHSYLLEQPPGLQHLFAYGRWVQDEWFRILSLSYPCQREVPVRNAGVTGRIDILIRMPDCEGGECEFYDVPVEVKYTQVSDPAHLWQLAAYMYAGDYQEGYLIRDRGREQEIVQLNLRDAGFTSRRPVYEAIWPNGPVYTYNGQPFSITVEQLASQIAAHNQAYLRPEEHRYSLPTLYHEGAWRCLWSQGEKLVPNCAWFGQCWGSTALAFDTEWEEGQPSVLIEGKRLPLAGQFARRER